MRKMKPKEAAIFEIFFRIIPIILTFGIILAFKGYSLYFSDFELSLGRIGSFGVAVVICTVVQMFVNSNPILKTTKAGIVTGTIITIETMLFMLFMQYHFWGSVVFISLFYLLSLWLNRKIVNINSERAEMTDRLFKWCKHRSSAIASFALCIAMLVPSCIGVYEEYHKYSLSAEEWVAFVEWFNEGNEEPDKNKESLIEHEDKLLGLSEWESLSLSEKERLIRSVALIEKEMLGIDDSVEITVSTEKMSDSTCGYYLDSTKEIFINYKHLNEAEMSEVLDTIIHEMHHAFVHYTVETLDFESETVKNSYYYKRAREWKENTENYISASTNFEDYENQPIEADARSYAEERVVVYLNFAASVQE